MNAVNKKYRSVNQPPGLKPQPRRSILLFFLICVILGAFAAWKGADFLEIDEDGNVDISSKRQKQFNKRLKRIRKSEQYVLLAEMDGFYPCYNCGTETLIFLLKGEIWKYGVTIQGPKGRYGKMLSGMALLYKVEFIGPMQDCLEQEAIKIYHYAKLPENLKRDHPIIRPPGNRVDL